VRQRVRGERRRVETVAKTYQMVRLDGETHARLLAYVASVEEATGGRGPWEYDERGPGRAVLASVIGELLRGVERHRARARAQRDRAKARRARARAATMFDRTWQRLAKVGACDSAGGVESLRVWLEWTRAGRPVDVEGFIRAAANRAPSA